MYLFFLLQSAQKFPPSCIFATLSLCTSMHFCTSICLNSHSTTSLFSLFRCSLRDGQDSVSEQSFLEDWQCLKSVRLFFPSFYFVHARSCKVVYIRITIDSVNWFPPYKIRSYILYVVML